MIMRAKALMATQLRGKKRLVEEVETDHESDKRLLVQNGVSVFVIKSPQLGVGGVFNRRNNDRTFGIMQRFSSMSEPLGEFMNRSLLCTHTCFFLCLITEKTNYTKKIPKTL